MRKESLFNKREKENDRNTGVPGARKPYTEP